MRYIKIVYQKLNLLIIMIILTFIPFYFMDCSSQTEKEENPNISYFSKIYIDKLGFPKLINGIIDHKGYTEYYKYINIKNQKSILKYLYNIKKEEWILDANDRPLKHISYNYNGSEEFIINYDYINGKIFSANKLQNKTYCEIRRYYYDRKSTYITKIIALDRQNKSYQKYVFNYTNDKCMLKIYVFSSDKKYIGLHKLVFNKDHDLVEYSQYKNDDTLKKTCRYNYNYNDECIRYDEYDEKGNLVLYKTFNYDMSKKIKDEKPFLI